MKLPLACLLAALGPRGDIPRVATGDGHLSTYSIPVAAGPTHADWPLLAVAELDPRTLEVSDPSRRDAARWAARFAAPPELAPPNGGGVWWESNHGFIVCGPPGHPDDRIDVADVVVRGREVVVTLEHWPTGRPRADTNCRPRAVVSMDPMIAPGHYFLTVLWKQFAPAAGAAPFWKLTSVREAVVPMSVYMEAPPKGARAAEVSAGDFRPVPFDFADAARLRAPAPRCDLAEIGGLEPSASADFVRVATGTFDRVAWMERGEHFSKSVPTLRPARRGEALYAVVHSPPEYHGDHCRFGPAEWADGGYVLPVRFFQSGVVCGSNSMRRPAYIVPLPALPAGAPDVVPVTVRWTLLHARRYHASVGTPYRELGPEEAAPTELAPHPARGRPNRPAWMDAPSRCELRLAP